jgi:hypothetical protein
MRHAALALDAEDEPWSANDQSVLLVDDQDRQPHRVVVNAIEHALDSELADVGVPARPGRDLALLGRDALGSIDPLGLALDHARQGRQADLADTCSG